jgi:hypothetical protein
MRLPAAALLTPAAPSVFDEDSSHRLGGRPKEVVPVVPGAVATYQPQVRLVDQRCRLERMVRAFAAELSARQNAQLLIYDRE